MFWLIRILQNWLFLCSELNQNRSLKLDENCDILFDPFLNSAYTFVIVQNYVHKYTDLEVNQKAAVIVTQICANCSALGHSLTEFRSVSICRNLCAEYRNICANFRLWIVQSSELIMQRPFNPLEYFCWADCMQTLELWQTKSVLAVQNQFYADLSNPIQKLRVAVLLSRNFRSSENAYRAYNFSEFYSEVQNVKIIFSFYRNRYVHTADGWAETEVHNRYSEKFIVHLLVSQNSDPYPWSIWKLF